MNKHSIKVPRLYKVSAVVAKEVSEGIGSIKSLVYEKKKKHPNIKAIYALVATLFQKTGEIETLLKRSQVLVKESRLDPWLAKILIVELLWGKKKLPGQSKPEDTIRAYEQIFKAHLSDDSGQETVSKEIDVKPRYVRVNTILLSLNEAIDIFRNDGWTLIKFLDKTDYVGYLEKINALNEDEFLVDIHVPNLLVFPSKTTFYDHPAYKNGSIILQDKASCLPVHILNPPPGSTVLDMCAAPGMKTTHLAAVMNNQGSVHATELNPKRFETLSKIVESSGAKCIKTYNKDVLICFNEEFPGVEYILVDPSCSGTGMVDRPEDNEITQPRLNRLTGFQIKILRHALTKFPEAKKVVYSTCSVLPEENEDVVRQVLETNYNFKLVPAKQFVGESWQNFGSSEFGDIGKFCLYAKPNQDYTNGFFVAVFERLKEGEENQFFNTKIFNFKKHVQANERWKEKKQMKSHQNQAETIDEDNANTLNMNQKKSKYTNDNSKTDINVDNIKVEETERIAERKSKKRKPYENIQETPTKVKEELLEDIPIKKKKTKYKHENGHNSNNLENGNCTQEINTEDSDNKKKKKKNKLKGNIDDNQMNEAKIKKEFIENTDFHKTKKRKQKNSEESVNIEDDIVKKAKKEKENSIEQIKIKDLTKKPKNIEELVNENNNFDKKSKKKKKSRAEELGEEEHINLEENSCFKNGKVNKDEIFDSEQYQIESDIKKKHKKVKNHDHVITDDLELSSSKKKKREKKK